MNRLLAGMLLGTAIVSWNALADVQAAEVELTDGTKVQGKVVSMDDNAMIIQTGALGEMTVETSRIKDLETVRKRYGPPKVRARTDYFMNEQTSAAAEGKTIDPREIEQMRERMARDPRTLRSIMELTQNPEFQKLIADPEIVKAAEIGDMEALMSNPKLQNTAGDPGVQDIAVEIMESQAAQ